MTAATGPGWELRCGSWQTALADVGEVDALVVDAPYSERTHGGHRAGTFFGKGYSGDGSYERRDINYACWSADDVDAFVSSWSSRVSGWLVSLTDDALAPAWRASMEAHGRCVFAPLPFVHVGGRVRLVGDGPSSWTVWVVVGRPRSRIMARWGTLPGAYVLNSGEPCRNAVVGGKPLWLMRALIRDYTRPGDLVCDPCAGGGTTLLAAVMEGRRAIGSELDPAHFEIARKRLKRGFTPPLFTEEKAPAQQLDLTGGNDDA